MMIQFSHMDVKSVLNWINSQDGFEVVSVYGFAGMHFAWMKRAPIDSAKALKETKKFEPKGNK